MMRQLVAFALCCAGAVVLADGQSPGAGAPAPTQAPAAPVFRAGVDFVNVDVVVTDGNDKPITDLTVADFELSLAGHPQKIAAFEHIAIPVAHRVVDRTAQPAPPPDVATNAPASPNGRLFVMVIDDLHLIEAMIPHVQQVMTDFLTDLSPDDQVAMVFTGRSDLSVNFTNDLGRLLNAVDHVRGAVGFGVDACGAAGDNKIGPQSPGPPATSLSAANLNTMVPQYPLTMAAAKRALLVLDSVSSALANSGHVRRALVYVGTFSIIPPPAATVGCDECLELESQMQATFDRARRADVPIYTLDPRGIPTPENSTRLEPMQQCSGAPSPGGRGAPSANNATVVSHIQNQTDHLTELAINTGGRFFINRSNLTGAVRELVEDNGSFYELGFTPDPPVHDGQFHAVSVKVKRPGAHVRARAGYVAPGAAVSTATGDEILTQALGQGVNVANLTLRAFAAPVAASATGMTTLVTVDLDYPVADSTTRRVSDDLRLSVLVMDSEGKLKGRTGNSWHIAGGVPGTVPFAIRLNQTLELPPSSSRLPLMLRIGVESQALARAGTVQLPIEVPDPLSGSLAIGGVVLGLPGSADVLTVGAEGARRFVPFQPVTTRTFTLADSVRVFAPVFWGSKDSVDVTVAATGTRPLAPQHLTLAGTPAAGGRRQATVDVTLPLKDLAPGPCTIEVTAALHGGKPVQRVVPCVMEAPK